ncbi:hypothetical protein [uncultured Tenacibaculum sp.]|uniref:cytidylyltransferase domain-containing protein n=1 Tax=uncultured Tenacibaculum sp. TaxID=174713 RepID=UPI0026173D13|nr:hypothetical protein [uncultured Tenacibaculum sp.]
MNLGIIIQARVGSTRLHNKILLPIDGETTFLDVLLIKLKEEFNNLPIILATSGKKENDIIVEVAKKHKINVFRGDENNVLKRFVDCALKFKLSSIIRVCSDNPFLDTTLLKSLIENYKCEDYFSYKINNTPSILTHYGFFAEIVSLNALEKVLKFNNKLCLEHVTNCVYTNTDEFNVRFNNKEITEKNIRCTLDTKQDFLNLKHIYSKWYIPSKNKSLESLISFINQSKTLKQFMKIEIDKNSK